VNASYQYITSIAQSKNTGKYMLAIVSASTADDKIGRVFKSDDYGKPGTWGLLENLLPDNGTDSSHLNYAKLEAGTNDSANRAYDACVFYACAVSDDGKYQMFVQKDAVAAKRGLWYSTNYGITTGTTDEKWKYIRLGTNDISGGFPNGGSQMIYSSGAYPAASIISNAYTHFTGLTAATGTKTLLGGMIGTFFTSAVPALYDNNFTTISRNVLYFISGGNLYKSINGGTGVIINPPGWQVSNTEGGGIAVSSNSTIVVAARYANSLGGLWLSNDGGSNWTKKLVNGIPNANLNAVAMSNDGRYIITGPREGGTGRFYISQDSGATWAFNDLTFAGNLQTLFITNDGKRAVGAGSKTDYTWNQRVTTGYVTYIAPLTAAEQRDAGKTVAELFALSYSYSDIMGAGYTLSQLITGGIPLTSLLTVYTISQLRDASVTISQLRGAGVTISQLLAANVPISELLAANITISELLAAGATVSQLVASGVPFSQLVNYAQWLDLSATSNIFNKSYVNNFIDLSGDLFIRNDGALIGGGDVSFNNITVAGSTTFAGDTTIKSRLFIGNDISVNGNLYVGGDLSVNGIFSGNFANNVIPTSAIIDYPSSSANVEITGNVRVAGDASFNGTTVDLSTNTILQVTGQVAFTDGTTLSTYDNNILSGTFAEGNVIFKNSTFAAVTCNGSVTATTKSPSDYRLKTNVTDLDESYTVDNLVPIQYDNILSNKHEFGLIAHELQAVYPELVKGEKDGVEYQHVNYNGLIGVLVKEVQELKRRIEDLYAPINQ
jgi:cytoskeletal protein CcmA (bactofilin family)